MVSGYRGHANDVDIDADYFTTQGIERGLCR